MRVDHCICSLAAHVGEMHLVRAGLGQQAGDERADLAGAENQNLGHADLRKRAAIVGRAHGIALNYVGRVISWSDSAATLAVEPREQMLRLVYIYDAQSRPHSMASGELAEQAGAAAGHLPGSRRARNARSPRSRACRRWSCRGKSRRCKEHIAAAQRGERFVLQGGDCAESFEDCESDKIAKKLKILLQMSLVLVYGLQQAGGPRRPHGRPVRQAALGRHRDARRRDAAELSRRHRQSSGLHAPRSATPDPQLLLRGYERAALTLNFVRALIDGGFADLHHPEYWDLDFVRHSPLEGRVRADRAVDLRLARFLRGDQPRADSRSEPRRASTRATKACTCRTSRRRRASSSASSAGTTCRRTCRGSACAPRARRRARRVLPRHLESDRRQGRPVDERRVGAGADRDAQSAQRARTPGADPSHGRQGHRQATAAADRGRARHRQPGAVDLRSDARQHRDGELGTQDAALREHRRASSSRRSAFTASSARGSAACTSS